MHEAEYLANFFSVYSNFFFT